MITANKTKLVIKDFSQHRRCTVHRILSRRCPAKEALPCPLAPMAAASPQERHARRRDRADSGKGISGNAQIPVAPKKNLRISAEIYFI